MLINGLPTCILRLIMGARPVESLSVYKLLSDSGKPHSVGFGPLRAYCDFMSSLEMPSL